jgi:hypothetical protein
MAEWKPPPFNFMNEKSQLTQQRLCSEEGKRRRASGRMEEVTAQLKSTEKLKNNRKGGNGL